MNRSLQGPEIIVGSTADRGKLRSDDSEFGSEELSFIDKDVPLSGLPYRLDEHYFRFCMLNPDL